MIKGQFTQRKFLHQKKHCCCGSAFLLHDNDVLSPLKLQMFETRFQSGILLISICVKWQAVNAVTKQMLMLAQSMHSTLATTKL